MKYRPEDACVREDCAEEVGVGCYGVGDDYPDDCKQGNIFKISLNECSNLAKQLY